jgi:bifunctional non-homologous end joining protein LigD
MYATVGTRVPNEGGWTFEPKFDGIRVLAFVNPADGVSVRLVTRNGKDKALQFPEVVEGLRILGRRTRRPLVIDGEVVAIERPGTAGRFQSLQARMHAKDVEHIARVARTHPAVLVAFDLLQDGTRVLLDEPWESRRARLARLVPATARGSVRISQTTQRGESMLQRARRAGWEGVIAKRTTSRYLPGARSREWVKLKLQHRAEFVVGGWTEPRLSRPHLGALLLGYFDEEGRLHYAGHMGGGFTVEDLRHMRERLDRLARRTSPFVIPPRTNQTAHWVRPELVVEVKFAEWTADARLRQPILLGMRDDKPAHEVRLERESMQDWAMAMGNSGATARGATVKGLKAKGARAKGAIKKASTTKRAATKRASSSVAKRKSSGTAKRASTPTAKRGVVRSGGPPPKSKIARDSATRATTRTRTTSRSRSADSVLEQLERIERERGDGEVVFDSGARQRVSSLGKLYFPKDGITKGEVMRYYVRVAPVLLPFLEGRPLALRRHPEGIDGPSFYQQRAPGSAPEGVRIDEVETAEEGRAPRFIGGNLETLIHSVQMGAIAVHAWLSRISSIAHPNFSLIDLDPGDDVSFTTVVQLARACGSVLNELGLNAAVKTSGSRGIHIGIPLPSRTTYERSVQLAALVATELIERHPKTATVERRIKSRPRGSVYVDIQQNALGKSVVSPYSVRTKSLAPVSAPLRWSELTAALHLQAFTVRSEPRRLERLGDLWEHAMKAGNDARSIRAALS